MDNIENILSGSKSKDLIVFDPELPSKQAQNIPIYKILRLNNKSLLAINNIIEKDITNENTYGAPKQVSWIPKTLEKINQTFTQTIVMKHNGQTSELFLQNSSVLVIGEEKGTTYFIPIKFSPRVPKNPVKSNQIFNSKARIRKQLYVNSVFSISTEAFKRMVDLHQDEKEAIAASLTLADQIKILKQISQTFSKKKLPIYIKFLIIFPPNRDNPKLKDIEFENYWATRERIKMDSHIIENLRTKIRNELLDSFPLTNQIAKNEKEGKND
ncbi:hypothetical protein [Mycoplasma crocodyli]|uniref:Uncharacterized protein n=1 Tax=Mycoplasma crocodyli (strain ATCC 51981 / MP145) TaxID=512564 RepID=D5E5Q6_MYCCM|nr:hypothetical protein [Mycoplasma crocodyli]ADE19916.1 hypothetical protein MCRO_0473 [Mycoplasma crocodyli MP145]